MKVDYRYQYLNLEIRKVESVNIVLNESINGHMSCLDEDKSIEEIRSLFLDFMVIARTQMNLLHGAVDDIDKFNNDFILNVKQGEKKIEPISDDEFKKHQIGFRY